MIKSSLFASQTDYLNICPLLSGLHNCMTQPPHFETMGGDRFGRKPLFQGLGPTLWALWYDVSIRKLLARSLSNSETLVIIYDPVEKLWTFFVKTDSQAHKANTLYTLYHS